MSDEKSQPKIQNTTGTQLRFFKQVHYGTFESDYEQVSSNKSIEIPDIKQRIISAQDSSKTISSPPQPEKLGITMAQNALKKACDDYIAFRQNPKPFFSLKDPIERFNEICESLQKSYDDFLGSITLAIKVYPSIDEQEQLELFNTVVQSSSVRNTLEQIKIIEGDKFDPGQTKKVNAFYTYSTQITEGFITAIENKVEAFLKAAQPEKTSSASMSNQ